MKAIVLTILTAALTVFITVGAFALPAGEFSASDEAGEVLMVFAAQRKQPHPTFTTNKDSLDTVWIFFADGDFRQFVIMDGVFALFSSGTYSQGPESHIEINRTRKYMEGAGLQDYSSVHPYTLDTEEYVQLVIPGKKESPVSAVYGSIEHDETPDTYWIFYSDETFEQYGAPEGFFVLLDEGPGTFGSLFGTDQSGYTALFADPQ